MSKVSLELAPLPGFEDRTGIGIKTLRFAGSKLSEIFQFYGYQEIETPLIEKTLTWEIDPLKEIGPKQQFEDYFLTIRSFDVDEAYPKNDRSRYTNVTEQLAMLRPEGTNPVCRFLARKIADNEIGPSDYPLKFFYVTTMLRNEPREDLKPNSGKKRLFYQAGTEFLGEGSLFADAEICDLMVSSIKNMGFAGEVKLRISDAALFEGIREVLCENVDKYKSLEKKQALDAATCDFKDRIDDISGARAENNPDKEKKRREELLEVVSSLGLSGELTEAIACVTDTIGGSDCFNKAKSTLESIENEKIRCAFSNLESLSNCLSAMGLPFSVDLAVVRGLNIYTGPVFQVDLGLPNGRVIREAGGGGRYDKDVGNFLRYLQCPCVSEVPSTGFGFGLERVVDALIETNSLTENNVWKVKHFLDDKRADLLLVCENKIKALKEAHLMREKGLRVQVDFSQRNQKQLEFYAERNKLEMKMV